MTPEEFQKHLTTLDFSVPSFAQWVGAHKTTVYRWQYGTAPIPGPIVRVLQLLEERRRLGGTLRDLPA